MSDFDVLIINVYLLAIFMNLIKTKTIIPIYRLFKLLVILLFAFVIYTIFKDDIPVVEFLLKGIPLVLLIIVSVQTEVIIILKKLGVSGTAFFSNTLEDTIKIELIKSINYLSSNKIGALITFEKTNSLDEYVSTSYPINASLNSELLSTIFFPNTPLHDGAVIVRSNNIICAGAYFPPTERLDIPKQLGSRHRAAIGISEITDSLTIVVSEQTGFISVAFNGYLDLDINK
ncbi:MAG: diadenylate cyclase, partial [Candidatus Izimaplasma sp.]|nr:diadenylate cyclase [Candidatus Izimaplasma bacterium]